MSLRLLYVLMTLKLAAQNDPYTTVIIYTLSLHMCERRKEVYFVASKRGNRKKGRQEDLLGQVVDRQTKR